MVGKKLQEVGEKRGNHMTLQQLKYAILVAESKSMSEAARKSFVSQPAFSQAIQELEEEIQCVHAALYICGTGICKYGEDVWYGQI